MKKELLASLIFLAAGISFAGDAAAFKDIGFSRDGKTYIFAQYGKTDVKYQAYAEIYTVDIEKNEYVPGGVYKKVEVSSDKSGRETYEDLLAYHNSEISRYNCRASSPDDWLYVYGNGGKKSTDEIVFKDLGADKNRNENSYSVRLVPTFAGRGQDCRSSFYIDMTIGSQDGAVKRYLVGSPDIERKGVTDYRIASILSDAKRTILIFVIEKTVEDSTGTSIRYMVETLKL